MTANKTKVLADNNQRVIDRLVLSLRGNVVECISLDQSNVMCWDWHIVGSVSCCGCDYDYEACNQPETFIDWL